jgi:hypothetical protein
MGNRRTQDQAQGRQGSRGRWIMGSIRTNETNTIIPAQGNEIQPIQSKSMAGSSGMGTVEEKPYNWERDAIGCYTLAIRMISLRIGARRFQTIAEMYWQEQHGVIP